MQGFFQKYSIKNKGPARQQSLKNCCLKNPVGYPGCNSMKVKVYLLFFSTRSAQS